jgi:tetratricopeptide (TPR) repeat protein
LTQFSLLFRLYVKPFETFSRILDEGRLIFAALTAIATVLGLQIPRAAEHRREEMKTLMREARARVESAVANGRAAEVSDDIADLMAPVTGPLPFHTAVERFTGENPTEYFAPLLALALCFVPVAILLMTLWGNLGGFTTILFRDYIALLVCCLLAWSAPNLVILAAGIGVRATGLPWTSHPAVWWISQACFAALSIIAIRTLFGAKALQSAGAAAGAWVAGVSGIWLYGTFGSVTGYLASPFVLYYLYMGIGPQFRGLDVGLRSRQRLKQALELATLNPRDADAHYQLGLIYGQRRRDEDAIRCFRQAIEIAPDEPDSHYQLGRIAGSQGRHAEALEHFHTTARLDDKHSSSEVWREIGVALHLMGDPRGALQPLLTYRERRPYDPEGACWHGRVLAALGQPDQARAAFDEAIEAVRTMPPARRKHVRAWEAEASRERKKLPALAAR